MDLDPDQPGLARRKVCPRPSLTTSSCSVTVTATHQTVFCSVSKAVAVGNATQTTATTTCLSSAYTTVTGCSVANSVVATTVATTQTSSARALPTCGPDSCGSCQPLHLIPPQEPPQESSDEPMQQSVPRPLAKRGDKAYGFWQDIHNSHSGYRQWMPAQIRQARLASQNPFPAEPGAFRPTFLKAMPEGFDLPVSTKFVLFKDKPETLAIEGLWGCTVVLVVSNRGAWAAYFWERTMYDEQEMTRALDEWRHGTGEEEEMFQYNERGLDQLTDYERDGDVGVMFGNPADEDVDHLNIKAFIFAPRRKPFTIVAERYLVIYFASQHVNPDDKTALNKLQLTFNDKIEHNINTTFQHTLDQQHSVFFDHIKCDIYNTVQYTLDEQYCTFHHDIEHDHSSTARHNLVERHFFVCDIDQNNIPDGDKQALVDNVNNILIHSQENNDTNS
ncbi:hypothetical protein CGCF413_v015324 [Colletotrichum fructicola]|nr:hypothetical protein CFRS1_v003357 [Colletotrichum fructicola]KAF5483202.1 hypothetical protein CGCF413_v015324 [Colletotrichum fructicola]